VKRQIWVLFATLAATILAMPSAHAVAASYELEILPSLGGPYGQAVAISNSGIVVGNSYNSAGNANRPTVWRNGIAYELGTLGGASGFANALNDRGQIVGQSQTASGAMRATLWADGRAIELSNLGGPTSVARGINSAGVIVGSAEVASPPLNPPHAVVWYETSIVDLGTLGGDRSWAWSINDSSVIAGGAYSGVRVDPRATVWVNSQAIDLSLRNQYGSNLYAINPAGVAVGAVTAPPFGRYYPAKWKQQNVIRLDGLPGEAESFAYAINSSEQVVGYSVLTFGYRAVLWEGTVAHDLNNLLTRSDARRGYTLAKAFGINDAGWIVGEAWHSATMTIHAFVLKVSSRSVDSDGRR
jgi:probable HAF family extracellular repeat protein